MSSLPREFQRNLEHSPKRSDQSRTDDIQSDSYPITKKDEADYFLEILYIKFNPLNNASRQCQKMRIWAQPVLVPLITLSNSIEYKHHQKSLNQSSRNVKLLDCITLTRNWKVLSFGFIASRVLCPSYGWNAKDRRNSKKKATKKSTEFDNPLI